MLSYKLNKSFFLVVLCASLNIKAEPISDIDILPVDDYYSALDQGEDTISLVDQTSLSEYESQSDDDLDQEEELLITEIEVVGNESTPKEGILYAIPYRVGQIFSPIYTGQLIRNLFNLEYFKDIKLWAKRVGPGKIKLIIAVQEDPKVGSVTYTGTKHVTPEEIEKKLAISEMRGANLQRLEEYARQIKKLYTEKNYHDVLIVPTIKVGSDGLAEIVFDIKEGSVSLIKRVFFEGNNSVSSKKLRTLLFTREDWIFGAMDKAGTYQPEAIEMDRHSIENFYQSNGFLTARVEAVRIDKDPGSNNMAVTFVIEEGETFFVDSIHIPGNDMLSENELIRRVGIYPGQVYSKEGIRSAMESLRSIWGEFGYVNAEVSPQINPDFDNNTVSITLETFPGNKVFLNNVWIIGNNKTRDHVIRRELTLSEGDLLTVRDLERSKLKVEGLGYFDPRDGVNFNVKQLDDDLADVEFWLSEIKTGKFYATLGFGGSLKDLTSPQSALKLEIVASDSNILGTGMNGYLTATAASDEQALNFNLTEPWLFGKPMLGAFDSYFKKSRYDEIKTLEQTPVEQLVGGTVMIGVLSRKLYDTRFVVQSGFDSINFGDSVKVTEEVANNQSIGATVKAILSRRFQSGRLLWLSTTALQDFRSNPVHPNKGYSWSVANKFGFPAMQDCFGFYKFEADATYYTPIIGEYDLVFMMHGHFGFLTPVQNKNVPYRELFHIGGPATVRGFKFGEIGPQLAGDSVGGKKTFFVNTELIFPITRDLNMKGAVFYDGGAGWDTLDADKIPLGSLTNNRFDYRHAVGFGLRMLQPTPLRVDWGFKLDKRKGEKEYEISLTMLREF